MREVGIEPTFRVITIDWLSHLAPLEGFAPSTLTFVALRSVLVSYSGIWRIGYELHVLTTILRTVPRLTRLLLIIGAL